MAKTVKKKWGKEIWLVNSDLYCAKLLHISPGWQCSLHRHRIKDETFLVLRGKVRLCTGDVRGNPIYEVLEHGAERRIRPGTLHQFGSIEGAVMLEVSTHHSDADVERIIESHPIEPKALMDPYATAK